MPRVALESSRVDMMRQELAPHGASEDAKTIIDIVDQDVELFMRRYVKCYRVFNYDTMLLSELVIHTKSTTELNVLDIIVTVLIVSVPAAWIVEFQNSKQIDVTIEIPRK